ncbi:ABC transporter permease subunit [Halapricum desulfuricans]|uniref:ABC-type transport system involved in multi-copper enzyme maturation, permease component n=1 Tax=Halapricum desulfuricans TaxID=2841257 RepID=A0A897NQD3_9EURY|nr:ABC transporter permease subunit [Halapricum desulfuricans]QSG15017.1 ABC-type transport system involved in multi-copper enzyme maturation, permease component [Halapricum desulfuricans]
MNRLLQIARKDFTDAIRDRQLYALGALFLLVGLGIGYLAGSNPDTARGVDVPRIGLGAMAFLGSVAAISMSYNQIVGKRASGELRVLLSLPFSRTEVVYGTFLGRLALVVAMTTTSIAIAGVLAAALGAPVSASALLAAVVFAAGLMAVFVSLSIGLSAGSVNTTRAAAGAFGLFIVFLFRLWEGVPVAVRYVLNGFSFPSGPSPTWAMVWRQIQPIAAVRNVIAGVEPDLTVALVAYAPGLPDGEPYYAEPWFGAIIVLAWIVLPVTLGYLKLRTADL